MIFECSWVEFKHRIKEFIDLAPTLNFEELDHAFKAIGLSYLGMQEDMWQHSASIALKMATKTYVDREVELERQLGVENE